LSIVAENGVRLFLCHAVGWNCFLLLFLFFSVRVHLKIAQLQIRPVVCTSQLYLLVNDQIAKFEFETLESKWNLNNFFQNENFKFFF
jgi:hypothetical protein